MGNRMNADTLKRDKIIGQSAKLQECLNLAAKISSSGLTVLIMGESGTGKELIARAIHENSKRSAKQLVVVNCASLKPDLIESELFGREKGAFTGATETKDGLIKQADGGTLFLDEIGDLPIESQPAFLRVLEDHRFRRVGGVIEYKSDFRLVAATNKDLEEMTREDKFRRELYYRLRQAVIPVPPLRERPEDIIDIFLYYANGACEQQSRKIMVTDQLMESLRQYPWPGNVRELKDAALHAVTFSIGEELSTTHLPPHIIDFLNERKCTGKIPTLSEAWKAFVNEYMRKALVLAGGSMKEAFKIAGVPRSTGYRIVNRSRIKDSSI